MEDFDKYFQFMESWPSTLRWLLVLPFAIVTVLVWEIVGTVASFLTHYAGGDEGSPSQIVKFVFEVGVPAAFIAGAVYTTPVKRARPGIAIVFGVIVLLGAAALVVPALPVRESDPNRFGVVAISACQLAAGVLIAWASMFRYWRRNRHFKT